MVGHGGSSAGSYLADPTSPTPSHCASIVATSTLRVNAHDFAKHKHKDCCAQTVNDTLQMITVRICFVNGFKTCYFFATIYEFII